MDTIILAYGCEIFAHTVCVTLCYEAKRGVGKKILDFTLSCIAQRRRYTFLKLGTLCYMFRGIARSQNTILSTFAKSR
jgi:hypothetical protein